MAYSRTTWENSPSEATPISADNLNNIEQGILDVESSVNALSGTVGVAMGTAGTAVNTTATQGSVTATQGSVAATQGSVSSHVSATTSVHGITDTANLVYTNNATLGSVATLSTALTATQGSVTSTQGSVDSRTGILSLSVLQAPIWRYGGTSTSWGTSSYDVAFTSDDNSYYCIVYSRETTNNRYLLAYTNDNGASFTFPGGTAGTSLPTTNQNTNFSNIICSSNGAVIYATFDAEFNSGLGTGRIYKSIDSGTSFTAINSGSGVLFTPRCCSSNGSVIYATGVGGGSSSLISSRDQGATWSTATFGQIVSVACSSNGSVAFATVRASGGINVNLGSVLVTTDGGLNWSNTSAGNSASERISCSSNGSVVVATMYYGSDTRATYPRISRDSGSTWSDLTSAGLELPWGAVSVSPDGNRMIITGSKRKVSTINSGTSFYEETIDFSPKNFLPSGSAVSSGFYKATFLY